jgi:hypothetical protein
MARYRLPITATCLTPLLVLAVGCQNKYSHIPVYQRPVLARAIEDSALAPPQALASVDAVCIPPAGWKMEPLKTSSDHAHQVWLSPSGNTAYGVIHFGLPLPVSAGWVLDPFLKEMKKSEGEANLIGQPMRDDSLPGIRFTVEGGLYKMRINLICRGWRGWAVYAGTLRTAPEVPEELELAEWAKDMTKVGVPTADGAPPPKFIRQAAVETD